MITLGQQNGGPNIDKSFSQSVLSLRKLLETLRAEDYAADTPEFALILRVNGSLTKFGEEGVEPPKLRRGYIQVDIVVPESRWGTAAVVQRSYLANVVGDALAAIADSLEKKNRLLNREKLLSDYSAVRENFLTNAVSDRKELPS
jgi:hypothetical protein